MVQGMHAHTCMDSCTDYDENETRTHHTTFVMLQKLPLLDQHIIMHG